MTIHSSRRRMIPAALVVVALLAACGTDGGKKESGTTKPKRPETTAEPSTTEPSTTESTTEPTTTEPTTTTDNSTSGVPDVSKWVPVTDPGSNVKFKLPLKPTVSSPAVTAPDGKPVTVRTYNATPNSNLLVQVVIYDLAGRTFDSNKALDGVASKLQGSVLSRSSSTVDGVDVLDGKVSIRGTLGIGYDRVFKLGDYAVQLQTAGPTADDSKLRSVQKDLISTFSAG